MLRAELIKARTTRGVIGMILGAAATVAVITALSILSQPSNAVQRNLTEQTFYLISAVVVATFAIILGARSFTDEFRHGTIVPTLTLVPRRGLVLVSKMMLSGMLGAVLALVSIGVMLAVMSALAGVRGASPAIDSRTLSEIGRFVAAGALWGALGSAVGAAVRNQVAAIVGAIVWIVLFENVAPALLGGIAGYLPGRAGYGLAGVETGEGLLSAATGGIVLVVYVAMGTLVASALLRRDVGGD